MKKLLLILLCFPLITLAQNNIDANGNPVSDLKYTSSNLPNFSFNNSSTGSIPFVVEDSIPIYAGIVGLAYDGEFLWAAGFNWYQIFKISPVTGNIVDSIPILFPEAYGLTYDGNDLWIVERTSWPYQHKVHKIDTSSGNILQSFSIPSDYPNGLAWNGDLWYNDNSDWSYTNHTHSISSSTGGNLQTYSNYGQPGGLAWDGQYLWCSHNGGIGVIQKYDISTFTIVDSIITPWSFPNDLACDGSHLWVADNGHNMIFKIVAGNNGFGCTDPTATNYDPTATVDDGSCVQSLNNLSFGSADNLDIITWNLEWFPKNGQTTIDSLATAIIALDVDVIAVQEINSTTEFNNLLSQLNGYSGVYGGSNLRLGFIYKSSLSVDSIYTILPNYSYEFASRPPLLIDLTFDGVNFIIINTHFKCCGDGILDLSNPSDEETRRYNAMNLLKQYIDQNHSNDNVVVLGDFNDLLTDASSNNIFQQVLDDSLNYTFADMAIANGGLANWSYPSWPSHLDHILITNELLDELNNGTIETILIDNYFSGGFPQYDAIISDHRPVGISLGFPVFGCTDLTAVNYNPLATIDDSSCSYQMTYVPDSNFEQALINLGYDNVLDDSVLTANINTVTNLDVTSQNIYDLTGIEDFTALTNLSCSYNQLTSLDVSQNTALTNLSCYSNQLTSLDVSNNTALTYLDCSYNQISSLDVSNNIYLTALDCSSNWLTNIDVSQNSDLTWLVCFSNWLTTLDVRNGNNINLFNFKTWGNPNLFCIDVDDPIYSTANWTNIDPQHYFSNNCAIYGCTDPLADNYDATATTDDGSCTYSTCANNAYPLFVLNAWDITDTRFRLGWDNMNTSSCMVLKYHVRYRVTGGNPYGWTTRSAGAGNGLCNFGLNNIEKLMINFLPSTTYDIRLRVQYCDDPTAWSAWSSILNVTMADACPDLTNMAVQTFNGQQNKAKFTWDTTGVYGFARLYTRVNGGTAPYSWTIQGGFGIYYPTFSKNIFTFTPGETYRVQANSFCSATMTSYKGNLTPPVIWTQPATVRLEGGTTIANLEIFPNPSRDVFNVSFTSEDVQDFKVRILNVIGEELINEDLQQFIGEYTKQIDLSNNAKGIYFLEIETNDGVINKKLILQ